MGRPAIPWTIPGERDRREGNHGPALLAGPHHLARSHPGSTHPMTRHFLRLILAAVAVLAFGPPVTTRAQDRAPQVPDLKVEKYTLPNGLEVLLHEDHTIPVVGVNIWYKVG